MRSSGLRVGSHLLVRRLYHWVWSHKPGLVKDPGRLRTAAGLGGAARGNLQEAPPDEAEAERDLDAVPGPQHGERQGALLRVEEGQHLLPVRGRIAWAARQCEALAQLQGEEDAQAVERAPARDLERQRPRIHLGGLLSGSRHAVQVPDALAVCDQVVRVQLLGEHALRHRAQSRLGRCLEVEAVVLLRPELRGTLRIGIDVERADVHVAGTGYDLLRVPPVACKGHAREHALMYDAEADELGNQYPESAAVPFQLCIDGLCELLDAALQEGDPIAEPVGLRQRPRRPHGDAVCFDRDDVTSSGLCREHGEHP
mmetsp:Transcript_38516/g.115039  ORF Transcript_38516/g.115039 Transcript_38516/m.115039 type:complete len:313 (+) Transcript_38516:2-940(+)